MCARAAVFVFGHAVVSRLCRLIADNYDDYKTRTVQALIQYGMWLGVMCKKEVKRPAPCTSAAKCQLPGPLIEAKFS